MVITETSFPRGGVVQKKPKETTLSFGAVTKPKPRKDKPNKKQREAARLEKQNEVKNKPKSIEAVSAELLSFKTVREGMIILGCVKTINPTSIEVALPGRMNGTVNVSAISQTYLELTQKYIENEGDDTKSNSEDEYKPLTSLFQIGQVVCVKVMKLDTSKTFKVQIELSMLPKDIQADFQHQTISTNMMVFAAIAERQEHGFVLETGVTNLRGFLPETKGDLIVGGVYFCRVKKITNAQTASTATFELVDYSKNSVAQFKEPNVNHILPGILVKFNVTKVLKDGLQGTIFENSLVAYINEHQLGVSSKHIPKEPKHFEVNSKLTARVLYVMPLTKIVYLSLNLQSKFELNANEKNILPIGTIVEKAIVSHIGTGGIILKLPNAKGIISLRSLKGDMKANFDSETLFSKYQANSEHKVRVIHYDPIDLLHVCSVDAKIIGEKYFSCNDVKTGDIINATIQRKLGDGRYAITVGQIKGYIHPLYLSKSTPMEKLQPNRKLKCRVLCKNSAKQEIFVTNLKDYMDEKASIITANTNLSRDSVFVGVVKRCISDGWLIEFFDYLTGMIYRSQLTANELSTAEKFYVGQIIKVNIKHIRNDEDDKRYITLGLADFLTDIGGVHSGKISAIQPTGIDVAFLKENLNGFIPIMYLSDFPSLVHALHRAYQCNDDVEAIGVAPNCYSIRDVKDISGESNVVKKFSEIKIGDVIPAMIKNVSNELIDVQCLIKGLHSIRVSIHLNMFVENYGKCGDVTLLPDQKIYVRILAKNSLLKTLTCSARLDDVWPGSFKHTVQMVRRYFNDIEEIDKRIKSKDPIKSYRIGQIVEGVPTESDRTDGNNCPLRTFLLDGNVKVYVTKSNDATKKKDQKHKILIVWIDYSNKILYGTVQPKYIERAETKQMEENAVQQLLTHHGFKANVLLILEDIIIVYPTKWTNRFVYIPNRVHYNDFQPVITKGINEGSQVNVSVIDVKGDHFIGMFHGLYELYNRKIDQKLEFIKLEVKDEENDSNATKKKEKKNQKKLDKEDIGNIIVEIKEESDADDSSTTIIQSGSNKKGKKRKTDILQVDKNSQSVELGEKNDDETGTPSKKKKINKFAATKIMSVSKNTDPIPSKKKKLGHETPQKKSTKKAVLNSTLKKSPSSKTPSGKRFSMKLSQIDGAMDLADSSSEDDEEDKKLPGVSNFWSTDLNVNDGHSEDSESSSEDETDSPKKRKLSSKERFAAARLEEARIREIEKSLADDSILPTSIDQFDRLVMAEPSNSRAWINYMVFHVQATEIDRARAIGKKALKTIDVREQQERLNMWIALLNMELRFGSKDAFDEVLKEALLVNEPFKVYSVCLKIFADCKRIQELCDMVLTITKKFRQNSDAWLNAAHALFEVNMNDKAKALLNRASNSLPERDHISTISRFAIMCNRFDQKDHAHALFEQILVSYPKRVDCWSQYIDILIKANDIDIARQTLERAVTHKIPMKKMRTLFKKYLEFEQKYGNDETISKVKTLAANYVHNEINC
ncbi:protein RRP5 homolog [Contarinia nasturtii]|uniref:protein RRP5 homolog n=1 Tax=Contarinia nasturtii TaxID=265458 RepID=UPI0012D3E48E|nr:protein RRP5 homolog [Contarinia nasturtii]